jgi:lysophospholipase L1-like esterase
MRRWVIRGIVLLFIVELSLLVVMLGRYIWSTYKQRQEANERASKMWAYRDPLYAQIDREESELIEDYQPFVGWKTREYHSANINVDAEGVRRTIGATSASDIPSIYFFGGSSMWGVGHRDETTIPSLVASKVKASIVNYGEIGYGISQEVIRLQQLLKSGKRPNHVVFYDGCNDLFLTALDSVPHETFRDTTMRKVLGNIWKLPREGKEGVLPWNFNLNLFQRKSPAPTRQSEEELVNHLVQSYMGNIEILDALSKAYDFDYLLFWQPTLYSRDESDLTDDEKRLPDTTDPLYKEFVVIYKQAGQKIFAENPHNFYDLSAVFSGEKESVFTDSCHLTPDGNKKVSDTILSLL